ncbi:MAG: Ni,Fe-hydrogenase III large subunit [Gammaproteobacteria bacterium]|nr:Ni,Fe-hydrogenase III large subunit [Gammaproteobacteria bacterium]
MPGQEYAQAQPIGRDPPLWWRQLGARGWRDAARALHASGARLLALWAGPAGAGRGGEAVQAAFLATPGLLVLELPVAEGARYPGLHDLYPFASRMQRAIADLHALQAIDADARPWLCHGPEPYAFVRVAGEGVHEIAVGPVHAGIIEPGHFRFSVVGEKVLRLEERLGYAHKGIEQRFAELPLLGGERLAARVSGDSAVAYSWAYCQAVETAAATAPPPRAAWLRALALELERLANHLGDLGALGNDAGFAFGLTQFSYLKEQLLRVGEQALGARYLFDYVVPGGVSADPGAAGIRSLDQCIAALDPQVRRLRAVYDDHAGVRDRFAGTGCVPPALARQLGLTGLAGRASGVAHDLRIDLPCAPYTALGVQRALSEEGDVAARVAVRFDEVVESCRLVRAILAGLPAGAYAVAPARPASGARGVGLVEGWRGPVLVALEAGPEGTIRRCHPHDPSWQNWPVLEHAIIGNIVADFPLINKSFNLSYSGHDL